MLKTPKSIIRQATACIAIAVAMLMAVGTTQAQNAADSTQLRQLELLRKKMYLHYSKRNTEQFTATVEQLKAVALKLGKERDYYKAYGNQAIYASSYTSRAQGIDIAKEMIKDAEQRECRYGLYTAYYALGSIATSLVQLDEAIERYHEALEILRHDYPDESCSPLYLAMARVERGRENLQKVKEYVEYVLNDPKASKQHLLSAMSYKYMALDDLKASMDERDKAYAERKKMIADYGHDDNFGYIIDFSHALLHNDTAQAIQIVECLPESLKATKMLYFSKLYSAKHDYKQAYEYHLEYKRVFDSINTDNVRKTSLDAGMMIDKVQAENQAKDLRIANQKLEMERIANELRQKSIQEEALAMNMAMQQSRLNEIEAQRESDSLMANYKELQLSEIHTQMIARENAERSRRMKWKAGGLLAFMAFIFVALYANSRRLQLRRLKEAYDKLEATTTAKERIESELRIARDIQMAMVPHEFPKSPRLDLYASMKPAKEVGGDLYDFVVFDDKLYFCLGDVSGKGVPAALFMAMSARLFRTLCKYRLTPAEIATAMNNELVQNNDNGMFVTMFIGLLDLNTGQLDFCNAGHNPPILDGEFMELEANAPLGLWEDLDYEGQSLQSIKGQLFFLYSDGLNEAENADRDQYSDDRLLSFIRENQQMEARQLSDLLMEDLESHVNGADPSDDLTMLCMRKK